MIISGGSNIYPREVEDAVLDHPLMRDVCVFGIPDREWGERVVAAVVPVQDGAIDAADVIDFCKDRLAMLQEAERGSSSSPSCRVTRTARCYGETSGATHLARVAAERRRE